MVLCRKLSGHVSKDYVQRNAPSGIRLPVAAWEQVTAIVNELRLVYPRSIAWYNDKEFVHPLQLAPFLSVVNTVNAVFGKRKIKLVPESSVGKTSCLALSSGILYSALDAAGYSLTDDTGNFINRDMAMKKPKSVFWAVFDPAVLSRACEGARDTFANRVALHNGRLQIMVRRKPGTVSEPSAPDDVVEKHPYASVVDQAVKVTPKFRKLQKAVTGTAASLKLAKAKAKLLKECSNRRDRVRTDREITAAVHAHKAAIWALHQAQTMSEAPTQSRAKRHNTVPTSKAVLDPAKCYTEPFNCDTADLREVLADKNARTVITTNDQGVVFSHCLLTQTAQEALDLTAYYAKSLGEEGGGVSVRHYLTASTGNVCNRDIPPATIPKAHKIRGRQLGALCQVYSVPRMPKELADKLVAIGPVDPITGCDKGKQERRQKRTAIQPVSVAQSGIPSPNPVAGGRRPLYLQEGS